MEQKRVNNKLHLRDEVKPLEKRVIVTPSNVAKLIEAGYQVTVERSKERAYSDAEYEAITGVQMAESGSWPKADSDAFILGLKELPEGDSPLNHRHIFFAHCYKQQTGWADLMRRFKNGNGLILDLEFLVDDLGRRVAAFGRAAGLAGSAVGVLAWCHQQLRTDPDEPLGSLSPSETVHVLAQDVAKQLALVKEKTGKVPRVMVMGAKGRCGKGAVEFLKLAGVADITEWDMAETAAGGPFKEILSHDVFVNCIYLMGSIPPFLTTDLLNDAGGRQLSVVVDVSCDYTNPHNPLPIYNESTTFTTPTIRVSGLTTTSGPAIDLVSIDHLPSLIPRESSEDFSNDLQSTLVYLSAWADGQGDRGDEGSEKQKRIAVWTRAEELYKKKLEELLAATQ